MIYFNSYHLKYNFISYLIMLNIFPYILYYKVGMWMLNIIMYFDSISWFDTTFILLWKTPALIV